MKNFRPTPHTSTFSPIAIGLTILLAIGIGGLIGLFLYKVMVNDTAGDEKIPPESVPAAAVVGTEQAVLPSVQIFLLQQGVYQNQESVQQLLAEYKAKGEPIVSVKEGENIRVFVAAISDIEAGKVMKDTANYLEAYVETYPKELVMRDKLIQNLTKDEKQFLESAFTYYETLVKEGTNAYLQGDKYVGNIEQMEKEFEKLASFKEIKQDPIKHLYDSLVKAHEHMKDYIESRNMEKWNHAQYELLQFVSDYYIL